MAARNNPVEAVFQPSAVPRKALRRFSRKDWAPYEDELVNLYHKGWDCLKIAQWLLREKNFPVTVSQVRWHISRVRTKELENVVKLKSTSASFETTYGPVHQNAITPFGSYIRIPHCLDLSVPVHESNISQVDNFSHSASAYCRNSPIDLLPTSDCEPLLRSNLADIPIAQPVLWDSVSDRVYEAVLGDPWIADDTGHTGPEIHSNDSCLSELGGQFSQNIWDKFQASCFDASHQMIGDYEYFNTQLQVCEETTKNGG